MFLINEYNLGGFSVVEESIGDGTDNKSTYIVGPYLEADVRNQNGNYYPRKVVEKAMEKYNKKIANGTAYGELNHPHKPEIDLERISHRIMNMWFEGNTVMGKSKLLDTDVGRTAQVLVKEGVNFGVSLRALGSFNGKREMQEDFTLLAVDIVADPSFSNAMMDIVIENKEYIMQGDNIVEKAVNKLQSGYTSNANTTELLQEFFQSLRNK
jgi:hypothetical protein